VVLPSKRIETACPEESSACRQAYLQHTLRGTAKKNKPDGLFEVKKCCLTAGWEFAKARPPPTRPASRTFMLVVVFAHRRRLSVPPALIFSRASYSRRPHIFATR